VGGTTEVAYVKIAETGRRVFGSMPMAELVANCPRCGARSITFNVKEVQFLGSRDGGWQHAYEAFAICRNCTRSTTFVIEEATGHDPKMFENVSPLKVQGSLNNYFTIEGFISLKHQGTVAPPEHVPDRVAKVFREGATCLNVQCWNAAGTMFRTCVDLATGPMLPDEDVSGLNKKTRRDLGLRLPWLFDNGKLATDLRDLSTAIREDANDGAHQGTLTKEDAEDLMDFTTALLERIFTEPERLRIAKERRQKRRQP
jgi:Domain of unknown function (DUF4145)